MAISFARLARATAPCMWVFRNRGAPARSRRKHTLSVPAETGVTRAFSSQKWRSNVLQSASLPVRLFGLVAPDSKNSSLLSTIERREVIDLIVAKVLRKRRGALSDLFAFLLRQFL